MKMKACKVITRMWNNVQIVPAITCPKGSKVQLLTRYGCAIYGQWNGRDTIYTGWAPLPTRAQEGEP